MQSFNLGIEAKILYIGNEGCIKHGKHKITNWKVHTLLQLVQLNAGFWKMKVLFFYMEIYVPCQANKKLVLYK